MIPLYTSVSISESTKKIDHNQKLLAIGSCFTENIGQKLLDHGFDALINPYGIIYHPEVILKSLDRLLTGNIFKEEKLEKNEGLWHSWSHHGKFSNPSKEIALDKINSHFILASEQIKNLDWLLLTFGTAYGYRLKKTGALVANCHKYPADHFEKILSSTKQLIKGYEHLIEQLKMINPGLNIILTVSPIRHKKDGLTENTRSKARCILLAEALEKEFPNCHYFPSYEILLDELRDYRFFEEDLVHPTKTTREIIWEKFSACFFTQSTKAKNLEIQSLRKAVNHKPYFPDSQEHQLFLKKTKEKIEDFSSANTEINLSELSSKLKKQMKD